MLEDLPFRLFLVGLTFIIVLVTRYVVHLVTVRISLRHVPGPRSSSVLWGEEWRLYHSAPGSLYIDWHERFGKVVKFTGAFGVSNLLNLWLVPRISILKSTFSTRSFLSPIRAPFPILWGKEPTNSQNLMGYELGFKHYWVKEFCG